MGNYIGKLTQCTMDSTGIVNKYHVFFSVSVVRSGQIYLKYTLWLVSDSKFSLHNEKFLKILIDTGTS